MYIDPFVAGILSTILVELVLFFGYGAFSQFKNKKK